MHAEVQWKGGRTKRENHVLASIQEDHKKSYKRSHKKIIHTCKHIWNVAWTLSQIQMRVIFIWEWFLFESWFFIWEWSLFESWFFIWEWFSFESCFLGWFYFSDFHLRVVLVCTSLRVRDTSSDHQLHTSTHWQNRRHKNDWKTSPEKVLKTIGRKNDLKKTTE